MQEVPVAKAIYARRHDPWRIFWMRRDLGWHRYPPAETAPSIDRVLEVVAEDAYACSFG